MRPLDEDVHRCNDLKDTRDGVGPTEAHLAVHDILRLLRFIYHQIEVVAVHTQSWEDWHSAALFLPHHPSQPFNPRTDPDRELDVRGLIPAEGRFGRHAKGNRACPET